jgi:hypothetical protein
MTNGNNTAIRGSAYCAAGGTPPLPRGEDAYVGMRLAELGGNEMVVRPEHDHGIVVEVSARRIAAACQQGLAPNEKWRLAFSAQNAEVRQLADPAGGLPDLSDAGEFDMALQYGAQRLIANYELYGGDHRGWDSLVYHRAFATLGLSYSLDMADNIVPQVRIGDTSVLRQALEVFAAGRP